MRGLRVAAVIAWCVVLGDVAAAFSAVSNGVFTATWTPATDPSEQYEFRWRHFASPEWIALPTMPGTAGSMLVAFKSLPDSPLTDRWMCVDTRMVQPTVGPWLSETTDGPACNTVDVSIIPVPTPPAPVPPAPAPLPPSPPPAEIFSSLTNKDGVLTFSVKKIDCPNGVSKTTSALKNGSQTVTLKCLK